MISSEIRINGSLIAYLYCRNIGVSDGAGNPNLYAYKYHECNSDKVWSGEVSHFGIEGASILIQIVMTDVCKKIKRKRKRDVTKRRTRDENS